MTVEQSNTGNRENEEFSAILTKSKEQLAKLYNLVLRAFRGGQAETGKKKAEPERLPEFSKPEVVEKFVTEKREKIDTKTFWPTVFERDTRVLFVGESHPPDSPKEEMAAAIPRLAKQGVTHLGIEFFEKNKQKILDDYFAGKIERKEVLKALGRWDFGETGPTKIVDIVDVAKKHGIKIICLDLDLRVTARLSEKKSRLLRNIQWANIIQDVAKKNPKAKIAVYCGAAHCGYSLAEGDDNDDVNEMLEKNAIKCKVVVFNGAEKVRDTEIDALFDSTERMIEKIAKKKGFDQEKFGIPLDRSSPTRPADYIIHLPQKEKRSDD